MAKIDIDAMVPWDLTLTLGGQDIAMQKPDFESLVELAGVEKLLATDRENKELEARLRKALAAFLPEASMSILDALAFDQLLTAFAAAKTYFGEWLKKKQRMAVEAAKEALGVPQVPPTPSRASGR